MRQERQETINQAMDDKFYQMLLIWILVYACISQATFFKIFEKLLDRPRAIASGSPSSVSPSALATPATPAIAGSPVLIPAAVSTQSTVTALQTFEYSLNPTQSSAIFEFESTFTSIKLTDRLAVFGLRLRKQPTGTVTVTFASQSDVQFRDCSITFTATNYNVYQKSFVSLQLSTEIPMIIVMVTASSSDLVYHQQSYGYQIRAASTFSGACSSVGDPHLHASFFLEKAYIF